MSYYFLDDTLVLEIIVRNPIMNKIFPSGGCSYCYYLTQDSEDFCLYLKLFLRSFLSINFPQSKDSLFLLILFLSNQWGTFGEVIIPSIKNKFNGLIETVEGVEEIVIGTELLKNLRLTLDYCTRRTEVMRCK